MRILVVGDVHCKSNILYSAKEIFTKRKCDYLVFLGDACDNWGATQSDNAQVIDDLIAIKQELGERFIWLIGNHDWGYYAGQSMSGHIHRHEAVIQKRLADNIDKWEVVWRIGDFVFSHAGVSKTFAALHCGSDVLNNINAFKRRPDTSNPLNAVGFYCGGYSIYPGPLWARPEELYSLWGQELGLVHVIGHTPVGAITTKDYGDTKIILCDTFSQHQNGSPIGDRTLLMIDGADFITISIDTQRKKGTIK